MNQTAINGERYEARINRAIAAIDSGLHRELRLETLADAACLSPHHFHRVFHALTGETVHDFTTRLRLERALVLAGSQAAPAWKEIAARCGYRSASVFSRAFKRRYGVSPAAFDLQIYRSERPDRDAALAVSRYFLRPTAPPPDDFAVELVERPKARLIMSRARGGYVDPAALQAAYRRLVDWALDAGLAIESGRLAGASRDDPELTPLSRCRYDFTLEVDDAVRPPPFLGVSERASGWWVVHAVQGDMAAVDRAWNLMFKSWLPAAGLDLRDAAAEEIYRQTPEALGWERFDLLCCIPVQAPMGVRP